MAAEFLLVWVSIREESGLAAEGFAAISLKLPLAAVPNVFLFQRGLERLGRRLLRLQFVELMVLWAIVLERVLSGAAPSPEEALENGEAEVPSSEPEAQAGFGFAWQLFGAPDLSGWLITGVALLGTLALLPASLGICGE